MWPFGPKESKEARFWRWFAEHEQALYQFDQDQERVFAMLRTALKRVHQNLTFEFGPEIGGVRDFVVSADGIRAAFPSVEALVAAVPPLPCWRIIAFRPRRSAGVKLKFGGVEVDGAELLVGVHPDGEKVGITLYIPGYQQTPNHVYEHVAFLLLDTALGEYTVETRLASIDFSAPTPLVEGLVRFTDLPGLVDAHSA